MPLPKSHILNVFNEVIEKYAAQPKLFDTFLSHKQAEAQDRAKVFKCALATKGITSFYDRDELEDKDWTPEKVIELVARSRSLVFFITPTILNAAWCHWELYIAIKAKIPIILLLVDPWPLPEVHMKDLQIPDYLADAFTNNKPIKDDRYHFNTVLNQIAKRIPKGRKQGSSKTKKHRK